MKKLALLLVAATAGASRSSRKRSAHPLGNFTINRYSRIEPSGDRLYVLYVLDLAEIPTFQAKPQVAGRGRGRVRDPARPRRSGGTSTSPSTAGARRSPRSAMCWPSRPARPACARRGSRSSSEGRGSPGTSAIGYRDTNYAGRIGWKEITVKPSSGSHVLSASAPSKSVSSELLAYPKNLLQSPLDVTSARAPGRARARAPARRPSSSPGTCSSSASECGRSPTAASRA